jgi:hypothetical protein
MLLMLLLLLLPPRLLLLGVLLLLPLEVLLLLLQGEGHQAECGICPSVPGLPFSPSPAPFSGH